MTSPSPSFSENEKLIIRANIGQDINKLLLNPPKEFAGRAKELIEQIKSRQKIKKKLPEWFDNDELIMPPPLSTEQCSSPQTAHYKSQLVKGQTLIDLTGGMGVDTISLSDHFEQTHYVEQDARLCKIFEHNVSILLDKPISVQCANAETFLGSFEERATFFIDPARRDGQDKKVFHFENCSPNIIDMLPQLAQKAEQVLVKAAPMIDISLGIHQLKYVKEVHVVSLRNEVKEVLFLLDFKTNTKAPLINCVNLESGHERLQFTQFTEQATSVEHSELGGYLYDPNASIIKAGAFKSIAQKYQLTKLAANTHLYTSQNLIDDFPGRVFKVICADTKKNEIKSLLPEGKANVITKNHPLSPEALKNKLNVQDGGDRFLFGFRDWNNQVKMCLTVKHDPNLAY